MAGDIANHLPDTDGSELSRARQFPPGPPGACCPG